MKYRFSSDDATLRVYSYSVAAILLNFPIAEDISAAVRAGTIHVEEDLLFACEYNDIQTVMERLEVFNEYSSYDAAVRACRVLAEQMSRAEDVLTSFQEGPEWAYIFAQHRLLNADAWCALLEASEDSPVRLIILDAIKYAGLSSEGVYNDVFQYALNDSDLEAAAMAVSSLMFLGGNLKDLYKDIQAISPRPTIINAAEHTFTHTKYSRLIMSEKEKLLKFIDAAELITNTQLSRNATRTLQNAYYDWAIYEMLKQHSRTPLHEPFYGGVSER